MVKRLKEKMNTLLQARKENKNKGFTLVELIVVIVILAILVGVTIGGIYGYVNKSRVNTDINNASAIQSACAVLGTNKDVIKAVSDDSDKTITITWSDKVENSAIKTDDTTDVKAVSDIVKTLLPDGLPAPKVASKFVLTIKGDSKGNVTVTCTAFDDKNKALVAQE